MENEDERMFMLQIHTEAASRVSCRLLRCGSDQSVKNVSYLISFILPLCIKSAVKRYLACTVTATRINTLIAHSFEVNSIHSWDRRCKYFHLV